MALDIDEKYFANILMVGDKVLIKPTMQHERTKTGLHLPPGVVEKERLQTGYVIKIGPGYAVPSADGEDEPWKDSYDDADYVPLQASIGDLAIYMQSAGHELQIKGEKYVIIPHGAILMLVRDDSLFT